MKWIVFKTVTLKVLDFIHDILCPFFRDDIDKK